MDIYREEILEHWQNPQNFGVIDGADLVIDQINPLCGDKLTFYFKFSNTRHVTSNTKKNKRITDVSFSGSGCAISIASASILSDNIKGKSVSVISKITGEDVLELLGGAVAPARLKCAFLALEAVRKLKVEN